MHKLGTTVLYLLICLLKDMGSTGLLFYRLVAPLVVVAGRQPLTWYGVIMAALLYLNFAPVLQKWDNKTTGGSLLALLVIYPLGELFAKSLEREVTALSIRRHLDWQAEIDETVHNFNLIRAINSHEMRELAGDYTIAEVQMRMAQSQEKMMEVMGNAMTPTTGELDEGDRPSEEIPLLNLAALTNTTLLIIWGTQGGGKTTLAKLIAQHREQQGHDIKVADPHGSIQEWGQWELVGLGRNYKELDNFLRLFDLGITSDYCEYSTGRRQFPYKTLLVDEFTQWADRCKNSAPFIKSACSDLRKIHRCVIIITHSDTITGLGDAKGLRDAIDRSAVKLELETTLRPDGEYEPTGYGWLKYPKQERQRVKIPRSNEPLLPASTAPTVELPMDDRTMLEQVYHSQAAEHPVEQSEEIEEELSDRQRSLLEWSSGKGWLSPSKIQAELWSYRTITAAEILADFKLLRAAGYGALRSKYNTVQWNRDENQNS